MPSSSGKLHTEDIDILFLIAALIFGAWFRIFVPYRAGFPINDGGLFFQMIEGVPAKNYRLPENIQYDGLKIPFAYTPLALYIGGLISDIFNLTISDTLRWLPAITLIAEREYMILICYAPPFFIEPRGASSVSMIAKAILSSMALINLIFPTLSKIEGEIRNREFDRPLQCNSENFCCITF